MSVHRNDELRTVWLFGKTYHWVAEGGRYTLKRLVFA